MILIIFWSPPTTTKLYDSKNNEWYYCLMNLQLDRLPFAKKVQNLHFCQVIFFLFARKKYYPQMILIILDRGLVF